MLVLSRHANEVIRIGDDIVVSVQRISGNRVIIGIDAPQDVAIRRGELVFDVEPSSESEAEPTAAARPVSGSSAETQGGGLAGRVRSQGRGQSRRGTHPVVAPMGQPSSDWSATQLS